MTACWVLMSALLIGQGEKGPPPLTAEQQTKIQELVRETQKRADEMKGQLDQRQRDLAKHYAEFALNETAVTKLQGDILDLQKRQLENYHRMQVELRRIVGPDRFSVLRQRIESLFKGK